MTSRPQAKASYASPLAARAASRMLALEQRYVFDAALGSELHHQITEANVSDAGDHKQTGLGQSVAAAARAVSTGREGVSADLSDARTVDRSLQDLIADHNQTAPGTAIAFIDGRLEDIATLVKDIPGDVKIVLIDPSRDGVAQMITELQGQSGVEAIHILSHGSDGSIQLGTSEISEDTMSTVYRAAFAGIRGNLAEDADILVYGCNFGAGADGARASALLADLTGADVAASVNLTGGAENADWTLETATGTIDEQTLVVANWDHALASDMIIAVTSASGDPDTVTNNNTNTAQATWLNAGTIAGVGNIDLRATVIGSMGAGGVNFLVPAATRAGALYTTDDPVFLLVGANSSVTIKWEAFEAGTTNLVEGNAHLSFGDIDGGTAAESVSFLTNEVTSYAVNTATVLSVNNNGTNVTTTSTNAANTNNLPQQRILYNLDGISSWTTTYSSGIGGRGYTMDGNFDTVAQTTVKTIVNTPPELVDTDTTAGTPFINTGDSSNLIVPMVDNVPATLDLDTYYTDPQGHPITFTPDLTGLPTWLSYDPVAHTFSGTPPIDNQGPVTIPIVVADNKSEGGTYNSSITFTPANPAPTAVDDNYTATEDGPAITLTPLALDSDVDGDTISVQSINGTPLTPGTAQTIAVTGGTVNVTAGGVISFTPGAGVTGLVTIPYVIVDADGSTATANELITINGKPVLVDPDPAAGTPFINPGDSTNLMVPAVDNVPTSVDLDLYYTDPNGDPLTFTPNMTGIPAWLSYDPVTHVLSGTPPVDNAGPVTVPVTVDDGKGGTYVSSVTFTPTNPGPTAVDDNYSATEDGPAITLTPLALDSDVDGDTISVQSINGTPLTPGTAQTIAVTGGTVNITAGGVISFTPSAGFAGLVTIPYVIVDADGATATANELITINGKPVAVDPDPTPGTPTVVPATPTTPAAILVPAVDNVPVSLPLSTYLSDPNGDTLTITLPVGSPYSYSPITGLLTGPVPVDNDGDIIVPVTVDDGRGGITVVNVVIQPTNPGPTAVTDTTVTGVGMPVVVPLLANDTDPDNDPLTVTSATLVDPTQGTLVDVGGVWTFTPASGFTGTVMVNYAIRDQDGATSSSTHRILVNAPAALIDPDLTPGTPYIDPTNATNLIVPVVDNIAASIDLDLYYADPNIDAITITPDMTGAPAWLTYDPVTHVLSGTPPADNVGPVIIPVVVTDDLTGGSYNSTITFVPTNPAPMAVTDSVLTNHNTAVDLDLLGNDSDPDGDALTVVSVTVPPAQGTVAFNGTNWVFTPAPGFSGDATVSYTINDADGGAATSTHIVTVGPRAVDDLYATQYGTPLQGDAALDDSFPVGSVFTATSVPAHGTVTMNPDGTYTYTPAPGYVGQDSFTYQITTPSGQVVTATEIITVLPPILIATNDRFTTPLNTVLNGNAALGDTFFAGSTFAVATPPSSGTVVMQPDGRYTFTPVMGFVGSVTFTYTVTDPTGASKTATDTIIVRAPFAKPHSYLIPIDKTLKASARDGNVVAPGSIFSVKGKPLHGKVVMREDGTYTYKPNKGFRGTDTFTYQIRDPFGNIVTAKETIKISPRSVVLRCFTTFGKFSNLIIRI
jgi:large repetitive protein